MSAAVTTAFLHLRTLRPPQALAWPLAAATIVALSLGLWAGLIWLGMRLLSM